MVRRGYGLGMRILPVMGRVMLSPYPYPRPRRRPRALPTVRCLLVVVVGAAGVLKRLLRMRIRPQPSRAVIIARSSP